MNDRIPKVSVLIVTYNHERFVTVALDSVMMQECDFRFEIVVADDCSSDDTLSIIRQYADKYQGLIRLVPSERNLGITKNYQRGFKQCMGEYIAVLEGDDYWTSPHKLSRQVKFLDEHRECSICFNRFTFFYENADHVTPHPPFETERDYELFTTDKLIRDNFIGNFSACMYRKSVIDGLDESLYNMKVYDWMFNIVASQNWMIGYLPEVMSAYRKHGASVWAGKTADENDQELLTLIDIYNEYLEKKYNSDFQHMKQRILECIDYRAKTISAPAERKPSSSEIKGVEAGARNKPPCTRLSSSSSPGIVSSFFELILPPVMSNAVRRLWGKRGR